MNTKTYFKNFFDEKEIDHDQVFEIEANGVWHLLTYAVVIEAIKQTSGAEADKIADTLRKIDFANGDVKHYLRHLGTALAIQYNAKEG